MDSLTKGFCAAAMMGGFPNGQREGWTSLWPSPKLQVVDIQRYPKVVGRRSVVSRFYLAVSDSASLVWLVVPPGSEMEELIHTFQIEVGCFILLDNYTVVTAKNGLNVVVPLSISYSGTALSLLGNPIFSSSLFCLSREALTNRGGLARRSSFHTTGDYTKLNLAELLDAKGQGLGDYTVQLRIVWKGRQRQPVASSSGERFLFDSVGVDERGDAISITFIGGPALYDMFSLGDCVCAMNGSLVYRNNMEETVRLIVDERSSRVLRSVASNKEEIPANPYRMFGAMSVTDVMDHKCVGDIVSVEGIVETVFSTTLVNTRRGRVERSKIVLRDGVLSSSTSSLSSSLYVMDVTLWDDFARCVKPRVGERWCFCGFVVGEFMRRLTLSSRCGSGAFEMQLAIQEHREELMLLPARQTETISLVNKEGRDVFQVVFRLEEASETVPVLAKVQRVHLPLTYTICQDCGGEMGSEVSCCAVCGCTATEERFLVRLEISDGFCVVNTIGFAEVGGVLLGVDLPQFLRRREESPVFERTLAREFVGLPLLFWLLRSQNDDEFMHVVKCKHIDMARCASTLFGLIAQMMGPT